MDYYSSYKALEEIAYGMRKELIQLRAELETWRETARGLCEALDPFATWGEDESLKDELDGDETVSIPIDWQDYLDAAKTIAAARAKLEAGDV